MSKQLIHGYWKPRFDSELIRPGIIALGAAKGDFLYLYRSFDFSRIDGPASEDLPTGAVSYLRFSHDGAWLAIGASEEGGNYEHIVYDTSDWSVVQRFFYTTTSRTRYLYFSRDNTLLFRQTTNSGCKIYSTSTWTQVDSITISSNDQVVTSPDDSLLLTATELGDYICIYDVATGVIEDVADRPYWANVALIRTVDWSNDGAWVVVGSWDGLKVFNTSDWSEAFSLTDGNQYYWAKFNTDDSKLYVYYENYTSGVDGLKTFDTSDWSKIDENADASLGSSNSVPSKVDMSDEAGQICTAEYYDDGHVWDQSDLNTLQGRLYVDSASFQYSYGIACNDESRSRISEYTWEQVSEITDYSITYGALLSLGCHANNTPKLMAIYQNDGKDIFASIRGDDGVWVEEKIFTYGVPYYRGGMSVSGVQYDGSVIVAYEHISGGNDYPRYLNWDGSTWTDNATVNVDMNYFLSHYQYKATNGQMWINWNGYTSPYVFLRSSIDGYAANTTGVSVRVTSPMLEYNGLIYLLTTNNSGRINTIAIGDTPPYTINNLTITTTVKDQMGFSISIKAMTLAPTSGIRLYFINNDTGYWGYNDWDGVSIASLNPANNKMMDIQVESASATNNLSWSYDANGFLMYSGRCTSVWYPGGSTGDNIKMYNPTGTDTPESWIVEDLGDGHEELPPTGLLGKNRFAECVSGSGKVYYLMDSSTEGLIMSTLIRS